MRLTIDSEQLRLLVRGDELAVALPPIAGRNFALQKVLNIRLLGASSLVNEYLALHAEADARAYWMARALKEAELPKEIACGLETSLGDQDIDELIARGEPTPHHRKK